jgi:hypothetical protein
MQLGCELPNLKWNNIRAFAEHKTTVEAIGTSSASESMIYTLFDRAQQMFYHQPTRTKLHCFTIGGDQLRCFLFTRSGVITSNAFSIHEHPKTALRVFAAFFCGDLSWCGLKTDYYVKNARGEQLTYDCSSRKMERIDPYYNVPDGPTLVVNIKDPVCRRRDIISRGTFFFKARKPTNPSWYWGKGIKESWRMAQRMAEGDLLKRVSQENPNIAKYIYHENVMSTSIIRNGSKLREGRETAVKCPLVLGVGGPKQTSSVTRKRGSSRAEMDTIADKNPSKRIKSRSTSGALHQTGKILKKIDEFVSQTEKVVLKETNVSISLSLVEIY